MSSLSRREFLRTSAALSAGCLAATTAAGDTAAPPKKSPNIVLVILDTVRADKLGCYGYPHETSPAFDNLARSGVRFDRVIAQCNWTRPSVGSTLTSRFPRALGLYLEKGQRLNSAIDTLPKILQRNGYKTFGATANPNLNTLFGFNEGFDTYHDSNVVWGSMDKRPGDVVRRNGAHFTLANEMYDWALDFARDHADQPAYIQINAMEVHEWYLKNTMIRKEYHDLFHNAKGERYPRYLQSVRQLTDDTAAFVEKLSELPGWEDTLFVLMSDHGEGLNEHPGVAHAKFHGWLLYESAVVVPWVLYRKGWQPKQHVVNQPCRLLELMPTVLDCAGLPIPDGIEGRSMRPVFEGEAAAVALPEYLITESHWRGFEKASAYASNWKYFHNMTKHQGLPLFELQEKGLREAGTRTDQKDDHPDTMAAMALYVAQWQQQNPSAPPTPLDRELTEEEREQLRAIGYLDV